MRYHESNQVVAVFVLIAVTALAPVTASTAEGLSIPAFSATYHVRYGLLRGTMTLELERREAGYSYATSLRPAGMAAWFMRGAITERTTLTPVNETVLPLDYYRKDTIADPVRNAAYFFDRQGGRVTGEYKSQQIDLPMQAGGHNRISVHVAVMAALQSNADISRFSVFDRGRWKAYQFAVVRDQVVKTKAGAFNTVEVRYSSDDKDRSWSMHFAQDLGYLPVVLIYHEDGRLKSRAQLTEYTIENPD